MDIENAEKTLFPYGVATQAEVNGIIRTECVDEDVAQIDGILSEWRAARSHFLGIVKSESGIAETIKVTDIDKEYRPLLDAIASDYLFQRSFSNLQTEFKLVEIDKLVAAQRTVNLGYVEQLKSALPKEPKMQDLVKFCLAPKQALPQPNAMPLGQNAFSYSSPISDFRFLGGFPKTLTDDDIKAALSGGVPVAALVLLVGYGSTTCNAFHVRRRLILNNGFHRMYALRELGIRHAPLLIQKVESEELEFPPMVAGLPKDYLLDDPRPVLIKDFFDKKLVRVIHKKPRLKNVQIQWNVGQTFVPI